MHVHTETSDRIFKKSFFQSSWYSAIKDKKFSQSLILSRHRQPRRHLPEALPADGAAQREGRGGAGGGDHPAQRGQHGAAQTWVCCSCCSPAFLPLRLCPSDCVLLSPPVGQPDEGMTSVGIFFTVLFTMLGCIFLIVIGTVVYSHWNESRRKRFYWTASRWWNISIVPPLWPAAASEVLPVASRVQHNLSSKLLFGTWVTSI